MTDWSKLPPDSLRILEHCGTEPPFSSPLLEEHRAGTFVCSGCGAPLFGANAKFDSGSGWPSFSEVLEKGAVTSRADASHGMARTEVLCATCGGQRYCINGLALEFKEGK